MPCLPAQALRTAMLVLVLFSHARYAHARVIVRVPDEELQVKSAAGSRGYIWMDTSRGLYVIHGDSARAAPPGITAEQVTQLADGRVLLLGRASIHLVDGDQHRLLLRLDPQDGKLPTVSEAAGRAWIRTGGQLYVLQGRSLKPVLKLGPADVQGLRYTETGVKEAGGQAWLDTFWAVYRLTGDRAMPVLRLFPQGAQPDEDAQDEAEYVCDICGVAEHVWIVTDRRILRVEGERSVEVVGEGQAAFLEETWQVGGSLWFRRGHELFRLVGNKAEPVFALSEDEWPRSGTLGGWSAGSWFRPDKIAGRLWVLTSRRLYQLDGRVPRLTFQVDPDDSITRLIHVGNRLWLQTAHGLYRLDGGRPEPAVRLTSDRPYRQDYEPDPRAGIRVPYRSSRDVAPSAAGRYRPPAGGGPKRPPAGLGAPPTQGMRLGYRPGSEEARPGRRPGAAGLPPTGRGTSLPWGGIGRGYGPGAGGTASSPSPWRGRPSPLSEGLEVADRCYWLSIGDLLCCLGDDAAPVVLDLPMYGPGRYILPGGRQGPFNIEGRGWAIDGSGLSELGKGGMKLAIPLRQPTVLDIEAMMPPSRMPDPWRERCRIQQLLGQTWLLSPRAVYVWEKGAPRLVLEIPLPYRINVYPVGLREICGSVWVSTTCGAFRVDEDVRIAVRLQSAGSWPEPLAWVLALLFRGEVWIDGVRPVVDYETTRGSRGTQAYGSAIPRRFGVVLEPDARRFQSATARGDYSAPEYVRYQGYGKKTFHVSVRDEWGTTQRYDVAGTVVRGPAALAALLALLPPASWVLALLALIMGPYWQVPHRLLMHRKMRRMASFGAIPVLLSLSGRARRHTLRRFVDDMRSDGVFRRWLVDYVVPDEAMGVGAIDSTLRKHRVLLVLGQSGVGKTCYLERLAASYASRTRPSGVLDLVPVYIPLSRNRGHLLAEAFADQLASRGSITDAELAAQFLEHGGFLILIDGLNEVDEQDRWAVATFIDRYGRANHICVSSQIPYREFEGLQRLELSPLSRPKVLELLEMRLGPGKGSELAADLTEEMYASLSLPLNLDLAIEVLMDGRPWPTHIIDLYEEAMSPMLRRWRESGHQEYENQLYLRAYEMLASRELHFDAPGSDPGDAVVNPLLERRFLIRSGGRVQFRHDLIRAWLASKHLARIWRQVLANPDTDIDQSWLPALRFVAYQCEGASEVGELTLGVLGRDHRLARELFRQVREARADLVEGWSRQFSHLYGEADLA